MKNIAFVLITVLASNVALASRTVKVEIITEEVTSNRAPLKSAFVNVNDPGGFTGTPKTPNSTTPVVVDPTASTPISTDPTVPTPPDHIEQAGKVIAVAKDMVALGQAIYDLVQKGKPKNVTEYAPISVVPRDPTTKEYVDPFSLEGFSMPVQKVFTSKMIVGGKPVVDFTYKVMYSYGGSYDGVGKYLTAVQIIPASITTKYGWDFSASMKLAGIMNNGTKANPIAGVMVAIKYTMNSWGTAYEKNDTLYITGAGGFKSFGIQ